MCQAWSDVASEAVYAFEHGRRDCRAIEEWMEDKSTETTPPPVLNSEFPNRSGIKLNKNP